MDMHDYAVEELHRLRRINDKLEIAMTSNDYISDEPEQIVNNIYAMCEIAKYLY